MYVVWTALACLVHFVDSILWEGNATVWAQGWCDTGTFRSLLAELADSYLSQTFPVIRIQIGVTVAWAACGLCIIRRLYHIASPTTVITSQAVVRCRIILCFTHRCLTSLIETP